MSKKADAPDFRSELTSLINRYSKEKNSNTPDFILRDYLCNCLKVFETVTRQREQWYGRETQSDTTEDDGLKEILGV